MYVCVVCVRARVCARYVTYPVTILQLAPHVACACACTSSAAATVMLGDGADKP